jgi:hypothetical protein
MEQGFVDEHQRNAGTINRKESLGPNRYCNLRLANGGQLPWYAAIRRARLSGSSGLSIIRNAGSGRGGRRAWDQLRELGLRV